MVVPAIHSLSWELPGGARLTAATAALLQQSVCQMSPLAIETPRLVNSPDLEAALNQLIAMVMTLRSPTSGWPADVKLTPERLAPYISEEVWNLLDRLSLGHLAPQREDVLEVDSREIIAPIPSLVPRLLWMLASSGYEVMHLVEGGRASVRSPNGAGTVRVVRLVPVLLLTTAQDTHALDLVTQTDPSPSLQLSPDTEISLLDHDLDGAWRTVESLLMEILEVVAQTHPPLCTLLTTGLIVEALCPFQAWQRATLRLHLHLADMGMQGGTTTLTTAPQPVALSTGPLARADSTAFTLDDFASSLTEEATPPMTGILGDWLTFSDEDWVRRFLADQAKRVLIQALPSLAEVAQSATEEDRERACVELAYRATQRVDGPKALFKHTFVQGAGLLADLWPRFRWYLAQSSERVMQLMGGLPAQVLSPGRGWQQGILSLRPLMYLVTDAKTWIIDLGSGRLLPTAPLTLPGEAVVDTNQAGDWANQRIDALIHLVEQHVAQAAPAMADLSHGIPVHVRGLETGEDQLAHLTLRWCFTWAYGG